jgi:hypothetical protein
MRLAGAGITQAMTLSRAARYSQRCNGRLSGGVLCLAWPARSPRKTANRALLTGIRRVHMAHRGRHGAPRIHAALRAEGHTASPGRV